MRLHLQVPWAGEGVPTRAQVQIWAAAALKKIAHPGGELTVRVVGRTEMADLNARYRGKSGPTNVLAFAVEEDLPVAILGDVVICGPIVAAEAQSRGISPADHWAHLVIHGTLHLCGYDHQHGAEAERMEDLERNILTDLGITSH